MNKNVLLRNERRKKGWSQKLLADFATVSLSTIERAERGEPLRIDNIDRICKCLEKTPEELGLVQLEQGAAPLIPVSNEPHIIASPMLPISSLTGRLDVSTFLQPQGILDFGILDRLRRALTPQPKIDRPMRDNLQLVTAQLKRQLVQGKQTNWPGLLYTAMNQLGLYTSLLESNIERDEQITLLIGENCLLVADMLFNMHDYPNARRYYDMSLRAAHEARSATLQAIASGRYGLLLIDSQEYEQAEQLLEYGLRLAEQGVSSLVRSWLWAVKAEAYACKQESKACYTALEYAKEQLNLNKEGTEGYTFNTELVSSVYGATKLLGFEGACYLRLRQPKQAQHVLAASQQLSSHAHHQSLIHIDFAQSFIQQASPEEASVFASQALLYVQETGSKRAFQRILAIREDLRRWGNIPQVKALSEQVTLFSKEGA